MARSLRSSSFFSSSSSGVPPFWIHSHPAGELSPKRFDFPFKGSYIYTRAGTGVRGEAAGGWGLRGRGGGGEGLRGEHCGGRGGGLKILACCLHVHGGLYTNPHALSHILFFIPLRLFHSTLYHHGYQVIRAFILERPYILHCARRRHRVMPCEEARKISSPLYGMLYAFLLKQTGRCSSHSCKWEKKMERINTTTIMFSLWKLRNKIFNLW